MASWQSKLVLALRLVLAAVFVVAAWMKLREPWGIFALSIDEYRLLPEWAVIFVARTLPWGELALGVLLLTGRFLRTSAILSSALLFSFFTLLVRSYLKGLQIHCGCFGYGEKLSLFTLGRDALILGGALALTWLAFRKARRQRAGVPVEDAAETLC
jgi:putative oxidoreductase